MSADKTQEVVNDLNVENKTIFTHDNLEVLRGINSACVDLVYLDPPFNTTREFVHPIGSDAEGGSFKDWFGEDDLKEEWVETIDTDHPDLYHFLYSLKRMKGRRKNYPFCYLAYMAIRLLELHRILKPAGSIYLHCDPTMSHYLKVVLDCIFGDKNFRNEIVWKRMVGNKGGGGKARAFPKNHDVLLFYAKSPATPFSMLYEPLNPGGLKGYRHEDDEERKYRYDNVANPTREGYRYDLGYGEVMPKNGYRMPYETAVRWIEAGELHVEKGKVPRRIRYLDDSMGAQMPSVWTDILPLQKNNKGEKRRFATQKPMELVRRVILASSQENDVVLDPFCGCATTCVVAEQLNRRWVGIDLSREAHKLVVSRIKDELPRDQYIFNPGSLRPPVKKPPRRTDIDLSMGEPKDVYLFTNDVWEHDVKVGISKNWKTRLRGYQTGDPERNFQYQHHWSTPHWKELEAHLHRHFNAPYEWIKGAHWRKAADANVDDQDLRRELIKAIKAEGDAFLRGRG